MISGPKMFVPKVSSYAQYKHTLKQLGNFGTREIQDEDKVKFIMIWNENLPVINVACVQGLMMEKFCISLVVMQHK